MKDGESSINRTINGIEFPPEPQFDPDRHAYTDPETGEPLAGVTRIIGEVAGDDEYRDPVWLARGRRVHFATELMDDDDLDWDTVLDQDRGYLHGYRKFLDTYQPKTIASEVPIMEPLYRYAGRLDRIYDMELYGKRWPTVVDLKSGQMRWTACYQITGYTMPFKHHRRFARMAVELHKDGNFRVGGPWMPNTMDRDVQVWMSFLTIFREKERGR